MDSKGKGFEQVRMTWLQCSYRPAGLYLNKSVALVDCELDLKEILLPIELSRGMAINIVVLAQSIL